MCVGGPLGSIIALIQTKISGLDSGYERGIKTFRTILGQFTGKSKAWLSHP